MTTRVLPQAEWGRLEGRDIAKLLPFVSPDDVDVVVVEKDGAIIANWSVVKMTHLEGIEIDPDHRNPGVVRSLLGATMAVAKARSRGAVWTAAQSDEVAAMIERIGGQPCQEMKQFVIPIQTGGH